MLEVFSTIEFQMSFLLFIALAGYLIASRINQSAVIGEILVGLIVGPSLLGLITYTEFVSSLASLGAVILLFVIGLEFRIKDIANVKYAVIALCGVIFPWIVGYFTTKSFGFPFGAAVFVGTALTATSIAITANVLREMGKLKTEEAKAIIGAAVIDDILGLMALSMTNEVVTGTISITSLSIVIGKAVLFILIGVVAGQFLLKKILIKIDNSKLVRKYPEITFIFAMMMAFLYGLFAEAIGLSAIVGAFIAGASMGDVKLKHSKSYKEGAEYLYIIFASIFFVSLGILADFKAITPTILIFLIVLTIVAVLSKLIGCGIPAWLMKIKWKQSLIIGFGMSPRGEVAMIVALIGLNEGLIGQDIYVSIILMSLLTTIITPIVLRNWLYKENKKKVAA